MVLCMSEINFHTINRTTLFYKIVLIFILYILTYNWIYVRLFGNLKEKGGEQKLC